MCLIVSMLVFHSTKIQAAQQKLKRLDCCYFAFLHTFPAYAHSKVMIQQEVSLCSLGIITRSSLLNRSQLLDIWIQALLRMREQLTVPSHVIPIMPQSYLRYKSKWSDLGHSISENKLIITTSVKNR